MRSARDSISWRRPKRGGLDGVWLAEFHFNPVRSVLSSPIVVAGAIASRTARLRIGMAVYVLPLNNPLRVAEEVATVDHISKGRFDFGVGRSGFVRSYDIYRTPYSESQGRFREGLAIILQAWKGETFSYHGEYFTVEDATVSPRPYQLPHPPLRMAATTAATLPGGGAPGVSDFRWPARHGHRGTADPPAGIPQGLARSRARRRRRRVLAHSHLRCRFGTRSV